MFAVIESGGKQYKVAKNDVITVEKLAAEVGADIALERVLLLGEDGATVIGTPTVEGASVTAQVLDQTRGKKIIVFKKKRRKNYRRTQGHRQDLTVLRITEISSGGAERAKAKEAAPAEESKAPAEAKPEATKEAAAKEGTAKAKAKAKPKAKGETKTEAKTEAKAKAKPKARPKAAKKLEEKAAEKAAEKAEEKD